MPLSAAKMYIVYFPPEHSIAAIGLGLSHCQAIEMLSKRFSKNGYCTSFLNSPARCLFSSGTSIDLQSLLSKPQYLWGDLLRHGEKCCFSGWCTCGSCRNMKKWGDRCNQSVLSRKENCVNWEMSTGVIICTFIFITASSQEWYMTISHYSAMPKKKCGSSILWDWAKALHAYSKVRTIIVNVAYSQASTYRIAA